MVVGAATQSCHAILDRAGGGQHEDACPDRRDEPSAHVVAVQRREVPVKHDDVVVVDEGAVEACRAVERGVDRHPFHPQARGDRLGELTVVFDHKHAHMSLPFRGPLQRPLQHAFTDQDLKGGWQDPEWSRR